MQRAHTHIRLTIILSASCKNTNQRYFDQIILIEKQTACITHLAQKTRTQGDQRVKRCLIDDNIINNLKTLQLSSSVIERVC